MLGEVSAADLAVAVAVAFFACAVFSAMGFGIGIVGLPLLLLAFDAPTAIILLNVLATPVVVVMVLRNREHLPGREIAPIALAGIVGSLIGARALRALDIAAYSDAFGIAILALIILLTVGGMFKMPFPKPNPRIAGPVAGFLVGLFITAIGIGRAAAGFIYAVAGLEPAVHTRVNGALLRVHDDFACGGLRGERAADAAAPDADSGGVCPRGDSRRAGGQDSRKADGRDMAAGGGGDGAGNERAGAGAGGGRAVGRVGLG